MGGLGDTIDFCFWLYGGAAMSFFSKAFKSVTKVITNPVQAISNTINASNQIAAATVKKIAPSVGGTYENINNITAPVISTIGGVGAGAVLLPLAAGGGAVATGGGVASAATAAPAGYMMDYSRLNLADAAKNYFNQSASIPKSPNVSTSADSGSGFLSGPGIYIALGGGLLLIFLAIIFKMKR